MRAKHHSKNVAVGRSNYQEAPTKQIGHPTPIIKQDSATE